MKNKEIRMLDVEFKTVDNDEDKMIIEGYPIVFNSYETHGFTEVIDSKALDNTDMSDVPLKYNHDDSHLLMARTRNGSLKLEKDSVGLKMRAELIDTQSNKDIYKSIKSGLLDKMSFAFVVDEDKYDYDTDTRTILSIKKLFDVSVVDMPFYNATSVFARSVNSADEFLERRKQLREEHEKELIATAKKELLAKLG